MNIFKLDENPFVCAKYHCDKHVPKMGLETTQLLNNTIHHYMRRIRPNYLDYMPKAYRSSNEELSPRGMMWHYITDAIKTDGLKLYRPTHVNHPCSRWLLKKDENFVWLYFLWLGLQNEYHDRFKSREEHTLKISKFHDLFTNVARTIMESRIMKEMPWDDAQEFELDPVEFMVKGQQNWIHQYTTPFALAMPDEFKCNDAVESYRRYYIGAKQEFAEWRNGTPEWFIKQKEIV
tara:strand:+ start:8010 stop:8711 length:702 start_codon:yes stop_codon:yes gene_type:complete